MNRNFVVVIIVTFTLLSVVFYALAQYVPGYRYLPLMAGNTIMAALCIGSYLMITKQTNNPSAFVRSVYSATFLKLMVCMFGILGYVLINRPNIHKPTVFVLLGIYAVYTIIETALLSKQTRAAK